MVKIQKPIPKTLGNKPKLDNPIKQNKQKLKKEKSSTTNKANLLEDSSPVKEAKNSAKMGKDIIAKNKKNKELNGDSKGEKKTSAPAPESPVEQKNGKPKKSKNVAKNGVKEQETATVEVPQKVGKKEKQFKSVPVPDEPKKLEKKSKKTKPEEEVAPATVAKESIKPEKTSKKNKSAPQEIPVIEESKSSNKAKKEKSSAQAVPEEVKTIVAEVPAKSEKNKKDKKTPAAPETKITPTVQQGKANKKKNKKSSESETPAVNEKSKQIQKPKKNMQKNKKAKAALKNQQNASKDEPKKEKPKRPAPAFRYDPIPYDEEKFNSIVNTENIQKVAELLKKTVEEEIKKKKSSIFDDYRYFLQVCNFKIASCPKRMVRLNLVHPLVDKEDDVLLVVPDLQRGAKVDYEPTKQHWEDLLRLNGVHGITVMPMNQLRKEYSTFEAKRKLCASYEHFMCDGRISSIVTAKIGKFTQKPRNTFHPVRFHEGKDIKAEIEKSLRKTAFRQLTKGSMQTIPVGTHKFSSKQLAENILLVMEQLKTVFPGGLGNVRALHLKIGLTGTSSLPLYINMGQAPEETPVVIGLKEKRMLKVKREANEVLAKFSMTKDGKMIKLSKAGVEKKRKLQEMAAELKEDGDSTKKARKDKESKSKKQEKEMKELELPENEEEDEEDDDNSSDDDAQAGQGSDEEETEDDEMANEDSEAGEGAEVVENGLMEDDDEESDEEDDDEDEDGDDDEEDDDDDDDDDDESD